MSQHEKYRHIVNEEIAAPQEEFPEENKSYGSHKTDIEGWLINQVLAHSHLPVLLTIPCKYPMLLEICWLML